MIVVLVVFLIMFPMAVKRMVASGHPRSNAMIIWLLCTVLATGVGYVVFGPI
jgi:hypothetical protein